MSMTTPAAQDKLWGHLGRFACVLTGAALAASCGSSHASSSASGSGGKASSSTTSGSSGESAASTSSTSSTGGATASSSSSSSSTGGSDTAASSSSSATSSSSSGSTSALPAGWLYTNGAKIYVSNGASGGTPWMGRGVNMDDVFLCGYNNTLWMTGSQATLTTMASGLLSAWKPTFVRMSLGMASYETVSWISDPTQYATPMTAVIKAFGNTPNVYVLVTLRSDASMIGQDTADGDAEATGLPSDSTTTPSASEYPTGTDAVYTALVDTFANDKFVLFGLTNEPGGDKLSDTQISAAMSHAVGVIRAEEDKLGVPHHIVSVQGNGWTSDISFYAKTPLAYDNVVYEVHGYPPTTSSYTYSNIPVILGEYGSLPSGGSTAFYADVEAKQIPNLAWDFESYSDCAPDLLNVNQSDTNLSPTAWGSTVQAYLLAH